MFRSYLCGTDTAHENGFIHTTEHCPYYLLLYFKTPFFAIINGKRHEGRAGECILHRKGEKIVHGPLSDGECFINDWIYFDTDEDMELAPIGTPLFFDGADLITSNIDFILKEKNLADTHSQRLISEALYRILSALRRAYESVKKDESCELVRFRNARGEVMNHLNENWTLRLMADLTGYSVSRFSAKYSEYFSKSPIDELLEERLKLAKKLLSLYSYGVGEVAFMCGFRSIHYFSRFFKSHTGVSPTQYKRRL